ncbi:hypothetical protein HYDPIDRAFT_170562 [Hydnomerulius pinastri MD-312]|uniref:Uncharacterized protein n=1 Tax=Hydnomerulius pinastri MD-312 TaxID=994086 RepID=A0A0C9V3G1_9AGAM|nr:hypothetical protein HYDPIDRAFT_170562 [Hydnomerulius pinastri MD-312]
MAAYDTSLCGTGAFTGWHVGLRCGLSGYIIRDPWPGVVAGGVHEDTKNLMDTTGYTLFYDGKRGPIKFPKKMTRYLTSRAAYGSSVRAEACGMSVPERSHCTSDREPLSWFYNVIPRSNDMIQAYKMSGHLVHDWRRSATAELSPAQTVPSPARNHDQVSPNHIVLPPMPAWLQGNRDVGCGQLVRLLAGRSIARPSFLREIVTAIFQWRLVDGVLVTQTSYISFVGELLCILGIPINILHLSPRAEDEAVGGAFEVERREQGISLSENRKFVKTVTRGLSKRYFVTDLLIGLPSPPRGSRVVV